MTALIPDIAIIDENGIESTETDQRISGKVSTSRKKLYIESYGCQMNFSDSEIVTSILKNEGFDTTSEIDKADVVLVNTCSIRDRAEQTIRKRLSVFKNAKKSNPDLVIGVLGCMAERLKSKLLDEEDMVDIVAGPDAYRDLPKLVEEAEDGRKAVNTFLSREETYDDITPVRLNSNGVTSFISIMRGCDNMCAFCVVPFTRGRERSRNPGSILEEAKQLFKEGYREVTLLGQNVDSYKWRSKNIVSVNSQDLNLVVNFADLLRMVADIDPDLRVRFSTSHPKDITDDVLFAMKEYENICKSIHLPAQSGNTRILELMNRTYDREWYIQKVKRIWEILGNSCSISSDMITGFCTETEEDHKDTLSLMDFVKYDFSYMFYYSERPGTLAAKNYKDDIPLEVKKKRLQEIIDKQQKISLEQNKKSIGKVFKVLIEGTSRRSEDNFQGRNSANKVVVFPRNKFKIGNYTNVLIKDCTAATLLGEGITTNE